MYELNMVGDMTSLVLVIKSFGVQFVINQHKDKHEIERAMQVQFVVLQIFMNAN